MFVSELRGATGAAAPLISEAPQSSSKPDPNHPPQHDESKEPTPQNPEHSRPSVDQNLDTAWCGPPVRLASSGRSIVQDGAQTWSVCDHVANQGRRTEHCKVPHEHGSHGTFLVV